MPTAPITVVSVAVWECGRVLLGHRIGKYSNGLWCFPGGKADQAGETLEAAARREVREETGLDLPYLRPYNIWGEHIDEDNQVFTCVYFEATSMFAGYPRVTEPDKFDSWRYFPLDKLPSPMFEREEHLCYVQRHRYDA